MCGGSRSDSPFPLARPAVAHQVRCPADHVPTFHLLQPRGSTRLHRLPSYHPLSARRRNCYRHSQDPCYCSLRGKLTVSHQCNSPRGMIYKLVAYILCIPILPSKPNNKERDDERNEHGDDTEQRGPSGAFTLPRVNSEPGPFLQHRGVVRFHL